MTKTNEVAKTVETTETAKRKGNYATGVRYRRSAVYVKELATYIEALADPQRDFLMRRVQRVILHAMRNAVTYREAECLELYFVQGYTYEQISQSLHINVSTICRNIRRGEEKMNRVLTFARELLGDQAA